MTMGLLKQTVIILILAYLITKIPKYFFQKQLPPVMGGYVHPDFRKVEEQFRKNIESGAEKGGSFSVYYKGEPLVDLWGGYADDEASRPWTKDTLSILFSATKGVEAILVAKFVDQGLLDYNKRVSDYWPEFAQNGKDNITLELLISHQGGLPVTDETIPLNWMLDAPDKVDAFIERQKPIWPPGTGYAYHAVSYGLYLDRLLSRVDPKHRPASQIFREEIAVPFDIDMYNGMPLTETYRTTRYIPLSHIQAIWDAICKFSMRALNRLMLVGNPNALFMKSIRSPFDINSPPGKMNDPEMKQYPGGAFNGHGNARSLAKLYGIVANGGKINGKRMLSKKTVDLLNTPVKHSQNCIDGLMPSVQIGRGVFFLPLAKPRKIFGTTGYGGQVGYADVKNQLGFGYVTNHLTSYLFGNSPNFMGYQKAFYECFEQFKKK